MRTFRKLFRVMGAALALGLVATAAAMAQTSVPQGRLKICKVAGPGVQVGELFTFTINANGIATTLQVPAGPAPGGYCKIGPAFPVGSVVQITEAPLNGSQLINIKVDPPYRPHWINGNTIHVQIGTGVTEVTFTNKRTGYLEICKETDPKGGTGNYTFYVWANGWYGPYTVPVGACTPAIELPAGQVTIYEWPNQLIGCNILLPGSSGSQGPCNTAAGASTVTITPGDVSNQTIAMMINKGSHTPVDPTVDPNNPN